MKKINSINKLIQSVMLKLVRSITLIMNIYNATTTRLFHFAIAVWEFLASSVVLLHQAKKHSRFAIPTGYKPAFSLIEILQTVILVGIIAGLSVSFFKKVNNDDKLMLSSAKMLQAAIEEANLQMCSDETPYCAAGFSPLNDDETPTEACRRYYDDDTIVFDSALGYCIKVRTDDDEERVPSLKFENINNFELVSNGTDYNVYKYTYSDVVEVKSEATADESTGEDHDGESIITESKGSDTMEESTTADSPDLTVKSNTIYVKITEDGNISYWTDEACMSSFEVFGEDAINSTTLDGFEYLAMSETTDKNGQKIYYAPLPCVDSSMNYSGESVPMHEVTCTNSVPQWTAYIKRKTECLPRGQCPNDATNGYPVAEICYRLWDIMNHKPQRHANTSGVILPDLYWTCVEANACINENNCAANTNKANMILPNGARLYNLACLANTSCVYQPPISDDDYKDYQHIFIKADRVADDRTFKFENSSTAIINAVKWSSANNIWDGSNFCDAALIGTGNTDLQKAGKVTEDSTTQGIDDKYATKMTSVKAIWGISTRSETTTTTP